MSDIDEMMKEIAKRLGIPPFITHDIGIYEISPQQLRRMKQPNNTNIKNDQDVKEILMNVLQHVRDIKKDVKILKRKVHDLSGRLHGKRVE